MNIDEQVQNKDCKECFGEGTVFVYFADHEKSLVIQEWVYCKTCYPNSDCLGFDRSCRFAEEISVEQADKLIKEKGYALHVP